MNPWIYYAIDVVNSFRTIQAVLIPMSIICYIFCISNIIDGNLHDERLQKIMKWMKIIFIVSFLMHLFIPSNEAMVHMIVAQYGTEGQEIEDAINKIVHTWGPFIR